MDGGRTMRRGHRWSRLAGETLTAADPAALLKKPHAVSNPVARVILERAQAESRPRARADDHLVCLAVEGGGMRGAVSAGMCVVLEAAGLTGAFDRVYGVSAGALNGWALAAGQAAFSATHYQDAARRRVINRMRPLVGRSVIDFDLLFEELIAARKPLSFQGLASGPEFRALATSLETFSHRVLSGFSDLDELTRAVRASATLPMLAGEPPVFRGERMLDGGLIEPIPFETALREGATHVLVLRSRPAGYRQPLLRGLNQSPALREPRLGELLRARPRIYNRQAGELERGGNTTRCAAHVLQVTVPDNTRLIGRLESNGERVNEALRLGARALASTILNESIDLCWQPTVYRTRPADLPAQQPARASSRTRSTAAALAETS